jgi:hypothetical protein
MRPLTPTRTPAREFVLTLHEPRLCRSAEGGVRPLAGAWRSQHHIYSVGGSCTLFVAARTLRTTCTLSEVAGACRRPAFTRHFMILKCSGIPFNLGIGKKLPSGHGQYIFVTWQETKILDYLGFLVKIPLILL